MHRIGRTARAGRSGQSLLFLAENESSYTAYLKNKQVEFENEEVVPDPKQNAVEGLEEGKDEDSELIALIQGQMLIDKDLIDKS